MADKYIIRVTAGSDYDISKHVLVPVNQPEPVRISGPFMDAELNVRLENFGGLPRGSPASSPYFATEPHASNKDKYSMAIRFTPKDPSSSTSSSSKPSRASSRLAAAGSETQDISAEEDKTKEESEDDEDEEEEENTKENGISGLDLQFGNDFDHPIRDKLPPGFSYAMNIVKWWIDPGLEDDAYADRPYLYGPALSSFNTVHAGPGQLDPERGGLWFEEGGDEHGLAAREAAGAPATAKDRMKWALRAENKQRWVFQYGRPYCVDFYNPYLDFSDFSLRLPGFTLPIMKYWDGQPLRSESNGDGTPKQKRSHTLRYVLRNRATEDTYLVILFTLYRREDVNEDGSLKPAALEGGALAHEQLGQGDDSKKKGDTSEEVGKRLEKLDIGKEGEDDGKGADNDID